MISGSVAPFARFIISMTSAFLLLPSAFGLVARLARPAFVAGLVCLTLTFRLRGRRLGRRLTELAIFLVFASIHLVT
jgi:hypothetical protein